MSPDTQFLARVVKLLDQAGISYMVVGSTVSNIYGHPRTTNDVDLIIAGSAEQIERLIQSLGEIYTNVRSGKQAVAERMFNLIDFATGMKADLIPLTNDAYQQAEFARRTLADINGIEAWVMTAEDAVLSKLQWCKIGESERQYRDAFNIVATQAGTLDLTYLKVWADALGIEPLLDRLFKEVENSRTEP